MPRPYRTSSHKFHRNHVGTRIRQDILLIALPLLKKQNSSIHALFESSLLAFIFQNSPHYNTYLANSTIKHLPTHLQPSAKLLNPLSPVFFSNPSTSLSFPTHSIFITSFSKNNSVDAIIIFNNKSIHPYFLLNAHTSLFSNSNPIHPPSSPSS